MNSKQIGKQLRKILDPIVDRKNLHYNDRHLYCKQIKKISEDIGSTIEAEISPLINKIELSYNWKQANEVVDILNKFKKKGFYISDLKIATTENDGFYELKRKSKK
jgi:hypothetical protein